MNMSMAEIMTVFVIYTMLWALGCFTAYAKGRADQSEIDMRFIGQIVATANKMVEKMKGGTSAD